MGLYSFVIDLFIKTYLSSCNFDIIYSSPYISQPLYIESEKTCLNYWQVFSFVLWYTMHKKEGGKQMFAKDILGLTFFDRIRLKFLLKKVLTK